MGWINSVIVRHQILCNLCDTLAAPLCSCESVAVVYTKEEKEVLAVYTNDLSQCTLLKVWEDDEGRIHKVNKLRHITEAKVSKI